MRIITRAVVLLMLICVPVWAEIIILNSGKVFEGKIIKEIVTEEKGEQIILKTEYGNLAIAKSNIKQIAENIEALLKPADELWQEAKEYYEQALKLKENPIAKNEELLKSKDLLYEANQIYVEIRQVFPQENYAWIDAKRYEILELMKELRCARVRVTEADRKKATHEKKLSELEDNDAEGHYKLALWCKEQGLNELYLKGLGKVIKINPHHAQAREKLGFIREGEKWVLKKEKPPEEPEAPIEEVELSPPPKPSTTDNLITLLKSDSSDDKLDAIEKLDRAPKDKAIQPLIDEFVKIDQDPEVYEAVKSVLLRFNPAPIASAMKQIVASKKKTNISKRAQHDALEILSRVGSKEYVELLTKRFIDNAKLLSRGKYKSDQEKIQAYKELGIQRSLIARNPSNDATIPLVIKYLRPSTKPVIRENTIRLLRDIGTEKAAEALVSQLIAGTSNKDLQPLIEAIKKIGMPAVFMPLVNGLDKERTKSRCMELLTRLTRKRFGYDKEKWLEWWENARGNFDKIEDEEGPNRRWRSNTGEETRVAENKNMAFV